MLGHAIGNVAAICEMRGRAPHFDFRLEGQAKSVQIRPELDPPGRFGNHGARAAILPQLLAEIGGASDDLSVGILLLQYFQHLR